MPRRQGDPENDGDSAGGKAEVLRMSADLLPKFSGQDKTQSVDQWIQNVEDHAEIYSWSPLQQLLVARRALTGTAALWLRAERPHKTWLELKKALGKEFADSVDAKAIHEIMSARKKSKDESCLDYMLVVKSHCTHFQIPEKEPDQFESWIGLRRCHESDDALDNQFIYKRRRVPMLQPH
ncbi:hypothetical protein NE865_02236 [Phthorimaea operculella]|nr:hypothetical protein NE865_02236 [Phthorimaea operculella]